MYVFLKTIKFVMSIVLAATISGCITAQPNVENVPSPKVVSESESDVNDNMIEKVLELVNSEEAADKLIKTTYSAETLQDLNSSFHEILVEMPPECVRLSENEDVIYFIYKSDNGHYAFWLYSLTDTGNALRKWYCGKPILAEDFERMKRENATIEDVQRFDPYGSYISLYTGMSTSLYTWHYTVDGYMIRLDYGSETGETDTITKITKFEGKDNLIYNSLLPIDRRLIQEI